MSNSEKINTSLIELVNAEVSNLILGSESMAGATQSYVGSTKAHQDIFRDRIKVYREYIENAMNEEIIPRLVAMGYIDDGLEFKYSGGLEMSVDSKIDLYDFLSDKYEIEPEEIAKEFGVVVKKQFNNPAGWNDINDDGKVDGKDNVVSGGSTGIVAPTPRRRYRRRSSGSVANYLREVMNGRRDI
ncbi:hypothetical protein [Parabacteroides distasonis]|uniref:phage portal protein family protein n=1 Tax=Parabacteroides distasonis TaxID=823 RepID=UPI0039B40CEA